MSRNELDNQLDGQITLDEIMNPPKMMVAVANIFARARKHMTLNEQKTFVYALTQIKFTEEPKSEYVKLDKKVLANILGISTRDIDHLSQNLYDEIKSLPQHSFIEIADKDIDLYTSGNIISSVTKFKNYVRIHFNNEYLPLFTNLSDKYITMWSEDIFGMTSVRSVQFYELLRQMSYSEYEAGEGMYSYACGVKAFKEMFNIPKEGKGSYMRENGGFDRSNFEKYVIDPLCDDLSHCKMIQLVLRPDGKPYEKVKHGKRVDGYRFYWTFSAHPAVATANEVRQIQERVDKNPKVMKIAKDILDGEGRKETKEEKKKNQFHNFPQRKYDYDELEKRLLGVQRLESEREKSEKEKGNS